MKRIDLSHVKRIKHGPLNGHQLDRLKGQLDKLVESGRLTADEADKLRYASDPAAAEQVLAGVRARHLQERP